MDGMFPDDIVVSNILPRLDVRSLIRCSSVCRLWFNSIRPQFSHQFLHQLQTIQIPPQFLPVFKERNMELVGYSNGVICYLHFRRDCQLVQVYDTNIGGSFFPPLLRGIWTDFYGFGFDSLSHDYKVVRFVNEFNCLVLTLGTIHNSSSSSSSSSNGGGGPDIGFTIVKEKEQKFIVKSMWRVITSPSPCRLLSTSKSAIFCNEALYWRTDDPREMVRFHLHDQNLQLIQD